MNKRIVTIPRAIGLGLLMYAIIRLTNDSISKVRFWKRPWETTALELTATIVAAFLLLNTLKLLIRRFDKKRFESPKRRIAYEMGMVILAIFVFINIFANTFAALTDDGLQAHDVVVNNLVFIQVMLVYFLFMRADQYFNAFYEERAKLEVLKREKLETELNYLKAQINPHFLFNALNGIYFTIEEAPAKAQQMLNRFSGMLRYQLYECSDTYVPLQKEMQYMEQYVALEKERKTDKLDLQLEFPNQTQNYRIAPFLLQPLVENAFKYLGGEQPFLHLSTQLEGTDFLFRVSNSCQHCTAEAVIKDGIGYANLKRRLKLLYNDQYHLERHCGDGQFFVELKLQLHDD